MRVLLLALLLAWPAAVFADPGGTEAGDAGEAEPGESAPEPAPESEPLPESAPPPKTGEPARTGAPALGIPAGGVDPLYDRIDELVDAYHDGIGHAATPAEVEAAVRTVRHLLLDGVSLSRIEAAVAISIELHTPGRLVPFSIAIPLRIKPETNAPPLPTSRTTGPSAPAAPLDPELEARRAERRDLLAERRARYRLHRQWEERTRTKRALVGAGVPLLGTGYALGFLTATFVRLGEGDEPQRAWLTAIPVGGALAWGAAHGSPDRIALGSLWTVSQAAGAGLLAAGLAIKVDWPYDRDPLALRPGHPPLDLHVAPTATGIVLGGTW